MSIHYGISEETSGGHLKKILKNKERIDDRKTETLQNKSDIAAVKSDLLAEKLKVSTNKTNISILTASNNNTKTSLNQLKAQVNTLDQEVTAVENTANSNTVTAINANSRSKENKQNIATEKARVFTNATAIALRPISFATYLFAFPDLSSSYQLSTAVPTHHWPTTIMNFGSVDTKTTFRIISITRDEDVIPPANFSVSFLMKGFTSSGSRSEEDVATLNLDTFQISGKPYYLISRDYKLSAIFPRNYANIKCGHLYMKHNHGSRDVTVEISVVCAVIQF